MTHRVPAWSIRRQIRNTALLTVEGEHDDISGVGQTGGGAPGFGVNIPADSARRTISEARRRRTTVVFNQLALPLRGRAAHLRFRALTQPPRARKPMAPQPRRPKLAVALLVRHALGSMPPSR